MLGRFFEKSIVYKTRSIGSDFKVSLTSQTLDFLLFDADYCKMSDPICLDKSNK